MSYGGGISDGGGIVMEVSEGIKRNPSPRAGSEGTEERPTEV